MTYEQPELLPPDAFDEPPVLSTAPQDTMAIYEEEADETEEESKFWWKKGQYL